MATPHYIKRLLGLVAATALVAAATGGTWSQQSSAFPAWFFQMPRQQGVLWAVGYAPAYTDPSVANEHAKRDAYERLRRARRVHLSGEQLFERLSGRGLSYRGERFDVTGYPDTLEGVSYVDSARAEDMALVLAAWTPPSGGSVEAPRSVRRRVARSASAPDWIRRDAVVEARVRAVGTSTRYYHLENSWDAAERHALRRLATTVAADVRRLDRSVDGHSHTVMSQRTAVTLRNVQVVARWLNEEACYVLMEAAVGDEPPSPNAAREK